MHYLSGGKIKFAQIPGIKYEHKYPDDIDMVRISSDSVSCLIGVDAEGSVWNINPTTAYRLKDIPKVTYASPWLPDGSTEITAITEDGRILEVCYTQEGQTTNAKIFDTPDQVVSVSTTLAVCDEGYLYLRGIENYERILYPTKFVMISNCHALSEEGLIYHSSGKISHFDEPIVCIGDNYVALTKSGRLIKYGNGLTKCSRIVIYENIPNPDDVIQIYNCSMLCIILYRDQNMHVYVMGGDHQLVRDVEIIPEVSCMAGVNMLIRKREVKSSRSIAISLG